MGTTSPGGLFVLDMTMIKLFVVSIPCGTKFLREFNLRIGDFFCFAETNFCDLKRLVFLAGN